MARRKEQPTQLGIADKFAWKFLIEAGYVVKQWEFYAGGYDNDHKATEKCNKLIETVGIDWYATRAPEDDTEYGFEGTFDESSRVPVMHGTLVLNDGSKWNWGTTDVNPSDIIRHMAEFLTDPFEGIQ